MDLNDLLTPSLVLDRGDPARQSRPHGGDARPARRADLAVITEVRAGVYMFGDLLPAEIGAHFMEDITVTVLASAIDQRRGQVSIDAGGLALSKDRSTESAPPELRACSHARTRDAHDVKRTGTRR
ncbi:MAG TPA: hypothetical protein VFA03_11910 [Acetobacteraceae bacterium]|nr:hypothetical protein [Acetobacteraceae bacterium]